MVKREAAAPLQTILQIDAALTDKLCLFCEKFMPFRSLKVHYKILEISCHGLVWLAGWLIYIWLASSSALYEMQVNFYIGILLDLVFVGVTKALTRRRRPALNKPDMFATLSVDNYSFPSGHASRACYIAVFFTYLAPLPMLLRLPLFAWCTSICVSRILLRRHHLLDVISGVLLGLLETWLISLLWLGKDASTYVAAWLADDNLPYE